MKMSDVFEGMVVLDSSCGKVGGGCLEIGDDLGWIAHFGVHNERDINESNEAAIHAIYAINNHDRMVEELKSKTDMLALVVEEKSRMTEEIAELKAALVGFIEDVGVIYSPTGRCGCDEKHYTITSGEIDDIKLLLEKLNQEGEELNG
ncbi:hypothetical protein MYOV072v1_p0032 [Vibrio phage 207E29.1]|nr:hypothetical protein MYOV072v1_p0032 [Vibrio phage 207E29.1]